jgi:hypothetical protein
MAHLRVIRVDLEDIDYFKSKHYDMPQALYESREGVRSDLGL